MAPCCPCPAMRARWKMDRICKAPRTAAEGGGGRRRQRLFGPWGEEGRGCLIGRARVYRARTIMRVGKPQPCYAGPRSHQMPSAFATWIIALIPIMLLPMSAIALHAGTDNTHGSDIRRTGTFCGSRAPRANTQTQERCPDV